MAQSNGEDKASSPQSFWASLRLPTPILWASLVALLASRYSWAWSWLLSGIPVVCFVLVSRAHHAQPQLPFAHLWAVITTLNLVYALAATSWILYTIVVALSWPITVMTCVFHFHFMAKLARRAMRSLLSQLHFVQDKIAFFHLPALEIDTDVAGLMVIRGLTVSLSSLTIEAHGVEVGIKLTDDMELAIQVEKVKVMLFRRIEVSDVFANLKGGIHEMTFGELEESTEDAEGNPLMNSNTKLIRAATLKVDEMEGEMDKIKMTEYMTDGKQIKDSSVKKSIESTTKLSPLDQNAVDKYNEIMDNIDATNSIAVVRKRLDKAKKDSDELTTKDRRAAICSLLHDQSSIAHPPTRSIKVTTLQNLSSPASKRFMHRLPFLLRLLLNPLSYFHPVKFTSITAAASGAWIKHMLSSSIFKDYAEDGSELRSIRNRMMGWLSDANFTVQLDDITGLAQVPMLTDFNIICNLAIKNIIVYRAMPKHIALSQVAQLGGADFTCQVPSFLLPHHEHLLPPVPSDTHKEDIAKEIEEADITPQKLQAQRELTQAEKDETNVNMSVHVRLPAVFDQTLLNFVAALVKATKLIEMDKDTEPLEDEVESEIHHGIKSLARAINEKTKLGLEKTKTGIKKAAVNGMVNDRWIAKLVGKVTKALENAHGDIGYSGDIPVKLELYREKGQGEASKLLP